MRIAVVSDTHGYLDPHLPPLLEGVDEILHAGDVGSEAVLDQLRAIAPVQAVCGNVDSPALGLPPTIVRRLASVEVYMLHELPASQSLLREWARIDNPKPRSAEHLGRFLDSFPQQSRVVIFGHTHDPCAYVLDGRLFFNPGSAGRKRFSLPRCFGLLEIATGNVRATFQALDEYNKVLPEGASLDL